MLEVEIGEGNASASCAATFITRFGKDAGVSLPTNAHILVEN
jgi:hypothetical protein